MIAKKAARGFISVKKASWLVVTKYPRFPF
jgi:hypothetical protein